MLKRISKARAAGIVTLTLAIIICFHITVLVGFVPYDMVWGGRLNSADEMIVFELSSIFINLVMIIMVNARIGKLKIPSIKVAGVFMWIFFVIFALNTIGNLLAKQSLETYIFTPVTCILAILMLRLALRD